MFMIIKTELGDLAIPDTAVCFPMAPVFPEYAQQAVEAIRRIVTMQNDVDLDNFLAGCKDWAEANERNRGMKLPLTPKPVAKPKALVFSVIDIAGARYVWQEDGPRAVCPDLPALPPAPAPLPEASSIRNVPVGDTMPVGYTFIAPDLTRWQKQSNPTPFGIAYFYARIG